MVIPQAFAKNTAIMLQNLLKHHEKLGRVPSATILQRFEAVSARLKPDAH